MVVLINMAKCWMSTCSLLLLLSCEICFSTAQTGGSSGGMSITGQKVAVAGQNVHLTCTFARAPAQAIQWNKDDVIIDDSSVSNMVIKNTLSPVGVLTSVLNLYDIQETNGGTYWCAPNPQRHSLVVLPGETQLNLTRADMFRPLELECNKSLLAGGRQEWWYKDTEDPAFVGEHPNGVDVRSNRSFGTVDPASGALRIDSFTADQGGQYSCRNSKDGAIVSKFIIRVLPYVRAFPKSRNVMEGDSTSIQCLAAGYPRPRISWHFYEEDKEADIRDIEAGGRVELKESENGIADGTLVISDLKPEDRGNYVCRASSLQHGLGMDEASILIRVKDRLAAVWPFLGICAEVAILCTIIFVYEKRRNKNTLEDPDGDTDARKQLNKNAADHKEANDDLRQRK